MSVVAIAKPESAYQKYINSDISIENCYFQKTNSLPPELDVLHVITLVESQFVKSIQVLLSYISAAPSDGVIFKDKTIYQNLLWKLRQAKYIVKNKYPAQNAILSDINQAIVNVHKRNPFHAGEHEAVRHLLFHLAQQGSIFSVILRQLFDYNQIIHIYKQKGEHKVVVESKSWSFFTFWKQPTSQFEKLAFAENLKELLNANTQLILGAGLDVNRMIYNIEKIGKKLVRHTSPGVKTKIDAIFKDIKEKLEGLQAVLKAEHEASFFFSLESVVFTVLATARDALLFTFEPGLQMWGRFVEVFSMPIVLAYGCYGHANSLARSAHTVTKTVFAVPVSTWRLGRSTVSKVVNSVGGVISLLSLVSGKFNATIGQIDRNVKKVQRQLAP